LIDTTAVEIIQITITSLIGMFGLGISMEGYIMGTVNNLLRAVFLIAGLALIYPGLYTDLIGMVVIGLGILYQWYKYKRSATKNH